MKRILMKRSGYNGTKDVLFVMTKDVSELAAKLFPKRWEVIDEVEVKKNKFVYNDKTYIVFNDNSARPEVSPTLK